MLTPDQIVNKMMAQDQMSQWLGIEIINIKKGAVELKLIVKSVMLNGFHIAHGGITYSLSDTCMAFSSNTHGNQAVSVESSISHHKAVQLGDILTTHIEEISLSKKFGVYLIKIYSQNNDLVSSFKGTMYFRSSVWI